jgi:hypothetical protein
MKLQNRVSLLAVLAMLVPRGVIYAQGVDQNNTDLPPNGVYLTPQAVHAMYSGPGLAIVLSDVHHQPFTNAVVRTPVNGGLDEIEQFNSSVTGLVSINGGPDQPVAGTGPVSVMVSGHGPNGSATGTFQTEMLSLDLSLSGGLAMIRESPTLPSLGTTTITPIGGGQFHIDSFFDVFTELSLDGGNTWIPSDGSARVELNPTSTPEPGSLALLGAGMVGLLGVAWRRRRRG